VHRLSNEESKKFVIEITQDNEEGYNDTRRWRCYETDLLMKKNEIRTDRKHPLTTPKNVSVRQNTMYSSKRSPSGRKEAQRQKFFLGKEKKTKAFFFFHKKILYSTCSRINSSMVKT
jgi:hypothetical protein